MKTHRQFIFQQNAGFDIDGDLTVHLLIYYTKNGTVVESFDFIAFGNFNPNSIEDDVIQTIREREHGEITFTGSKRISIL